MRRLLTALDHLADDARQGTRILTRSPGLSGVAVLLVALVIGGNTTIFSAVHGLLTRPAPGVAPDGLVSIGWISGSDPLDGAMSYPDYRDLDSQSRTLRPIASRGEQFTLVHPAGTLAARGASVSGNYFETLGVLTAAGRTFTDPEGRLEASGLVAVISHALWQSHFAGSDRTVGQQVTLNGHPATIVGVAARDFQGHALSEGTEVWVPLFAYARIDGREPALNDRSSIAVHHVIGRLAADASIADAQNELAVIAERLRTAAPGRPDRSAVVLPYSGSAATGTLFSEQAPRFLAVFSLVTAMTLLIVSANVANLLLARSLSRQREMAVRQSFGASRWRVVRLVLAEALTLAVVAWSVACLFASWMSGILPGLIPPSATGGPLMIVNLTPDWTVLGYAMALAGLGAATFSLAPALRTWRQDLLSFLKAGERGVTHGRARLPRVLVVVQLAFSVVLLIGAGLAYRSLSLMDGVEMTDERRDYLLVTVDTTASVDTAIANRALLDSMLDRLRTLPGVGAVSYARRPPQTGWDSMEIRATAADAAHDPEQSIVSSDYFRMMGLDPIGGRGFADREPSRTELEVVVNRHLADAVWPGRAAIGRQLLLGSGAAERPAVVVGVVPNAYVGGFRRARPQFVFLSAQQMPIEPGQATFYVRHAAPLATLAPALRRALGEVRSTVPIVEVRTMETELEGITWHVRLLTTLLTLFAGGSLLIAAIGQYAAMAFSMRRRERDFGIRIALGATPRRVLLSALGEGAGLMATGLAFGIALGAIAGRSAGALLYGVTPTDGTTYLGTIAVLGAASLLASYLPARRVARIDPIEVLRQD